MKQVEGNPKHAEGAGVAPGRHTLVTCRPGCGACCIALSISSPLPGMPGGKPAGVVCVNLDAETMECRVWGGPDYPVVCRNLKAMREMCGSSREEALAYLAELERVTAPDRFTAKGPE